MTILQVEVVKEVLSIEYISVVGLLLLVVVALAWYIKYLLNESKEKDKIIMDFTEKYYVISTKLYSFLRGGKDV